MANNHMKRWSTSFAIRKLEIKATTRCHYVPIGRVKFKTLKISNADMDEELKELSFIVDQNA